MEQENLSRRAFLGGALAAGALISGACAAPFNILRQPSRAGLAPKRVSPNEKVRVAFVGCGSQGACNIAHFHDLPDVSFAAFCDVDDLRAADAYKAYPDVPRFKDYRVMLDKMGSQIDAVVISTPDHMHCPIAMRAMRMGKHVYVEKPMAHTLDEVSLMRRTARECGVATQMGNCGHAGEGLRLVKEWIDAGALGTVHEVHVWSDRPWSFWPQDMARPTDRPPVPPNLDWDLWLGVAPERPYHPDYAPFKWRGWWDFGSGALGDMGCHTMDGPVWILGLDAPERVRCLAKGGNKESGPAWSVIAYDFPARAGREAVSMFWYDGGMMPPRPKELEEGRSLQKDGGVLLVGDKGSLIGGVYTDSPRLIPESKMRDFMASKPAKTLPRSIGHWAEFIRACKGGEPAGSNFEVAAPLTEIVLLGNVALRAGHEILWDADARKVTNDRHANRFVQHVYRKGWEV